MLPCWQLSTGDADGFVGVGASDGAPVRIGRELLETDATWSEPATGADRRNPGPSRKPAPNASVAVMTSRRCIGQ
jgi:hypothetical protein